MKIIGQSASRTVVSGEMSLRRLKLSTYEAVKTRGEGEEEEVTSVRLVHHYSPTDAPYLIRYNHKVLLHMFRQARAILCGK